MIEIVDFSKEYKTPFSKKNSFSVKNVSFTIKQGTITGLVGPNGSGKSTLIKAICGFHYPTSGTINIGEGHPMELCGYVPEISRMPADMKVSDFLYYCAKNHRLAPDAAQKQIKKLTEELFMSEFIDNRIKILSKGQTQRVSFAQALIHNPENLILDEPFTGLDPAQIIKFRNYIKDLSKTKSILISTHILSEVSNLCDNAFIMYQGQIFPVKDLSKIEEEFIQITEGNK